jgi:hypothetical protein
MNQLSDIGFGVDNTLMAGYAQTTNARLGNITLIVENTGTNPLRLYVKEYDGSTSPSGYADIGTYVDIVPCGQKDIALTGVQSQRLGFFGSGYDSTLGAGVPRSTKANITIAFRNPADLRGAQIDLCAAGRKGWGFDQAFDKGLLTKKWPALGGTPGPTVDI